MNRARYKYSCGECAGPVEKKPVGKEDKTGRFTGLHGWKCQKDGAGIKVVRKMNEEK